eukprot:TRINITY_DN33618_c0_g1_i1.p1 TRINITY_DN33618_c0_g1~~TRINITY_DN33618_c0_g1_i1.p1  ORF type:complete len:313 (+),score=12.60 TRINITY_DN33618_c0_g1_i1:73-939(+)
MADLKLLSQNKCWGGWQKRFSHQSSVLGCVMKFQIYFPPAAEHGSVPALWFLSGLTCTDENFVTKAGAQREASMQGIAIVAPDTSPRDVRIEGDSDSYDFGVGAGFYLDATEPKWKHNYRMYTYVTEELYTLVKDNFPIIADRQSIMGHSMGGHGALTIGLKNPGKYKSISAFSPVSNPTEVPWGQKAFTGYLGTDKESWKVYDATHLVSMYTGPDPHVLIDQGTDDNFYKGTPNQLVPQNFVAAAEKRGIAVELRLQEGYDHSYFFISTFIGDHIRHHATWLGAGLT